MVALPRLREHLPWSIRVSNGEESRVYGHSGSEYTARLLYNAALLVYRERVEEATEQVATVTLMGPVLVEETTVRRRTC